MVVGNITFGPSLRDCEECKRLRRAAGNTLLNVLIAGALLADILSDLQGARISTRRAFAFIAIIVIIVAAMAFIWGRYDGVSTLARKLNDARRREHEEEEPEPETESSETEPEAATTEQGESNA